VVCNDMFIRELVCMFRDKSVWLRYEMLMKEAAVCVLRYEIFYNKLAMLMR